MPKRPGERTACLLAGNSQFQQGRKAVAGKEWEEMAAIGLEIRDVAARLHLVADSPCREREEGCGIHR